MSNSLVSFLERRKKSAVKAATLLVKTDVVSEEEEPELNQDEDQEVLSDQDNEWKVSSDESDENRQFSSTYGPNVSKIIQAVENGDNNETSKDGNENKGHTIWAKEESSEEEELEEVQLKPKIWVPKFKEQKTLLPSRDDIGLAESVKMFANKNDVSTVKKKKKTKGKSSHEFEEDEDFVRVKFDVFSLLDPKYSLFKSDNTEMNEELVKSKYNGRKLTSVSTK